MSAPSDQDNSSGRPVATVAEVYAIAGAIRPWYRALVLTAAFTSVRWGELIALRRRDLDLDAGFVMVRSAALIYRHADRDSERAIAAGLSDTVRAPLADPNGHGVGGLGAAATTAL